MHHGYFHGRPARWAWNRGWYPHWFRSDIRFPIWGWVDTPRGYWQCTAFNEDLEPYSGYASNVDDAAYSALYECGDADYTDDGCYIPDGYCQYRN
jgi:hypothetical protein